MLIGGVTLIFMLTTTFVVLSLWQAAQPKSASAQTASGSTNVFADIQPLTHINITAVLPLSPKEIWIAGGYQEYYRECPYHSYSEGHCPPDVRMYQVYFQRYDGKRWTVIDKQFLEHDAEIESMSAVSSKEIYAAGSYRTDYYYTDDKLVLEKWNGDIWQALNLPIPAGAKQTRLHAVLALSSWNIWSVGEYTDSNGTYKALIYQWNGSTWKLFPAPSSFINLTSLQRIGTSQDIIATGTTQNGPQMLRLSNF